MVRVRVATLAIVFLVIFLVGVVLIKYLEELDWLNSFYLITMTSTTIGYGDVTPQTRAGKMFMSVYAIASLVTLGVLVTAVEKLW